MKYTTDKVKKTIQSICKMMQRIENKDKTIRNRDISLFFYRAMNDLAACSHALLKEKDALDAVFELAPHLATYRGKGNQSLTDEYVRLFQRLLYAPLLTIKEEYSDAELKEVFKRIATFSLKQVNGKRARTKRAASVREAYWRTLLEIEERFHVPESLEIALLVAADEKAHLSERTGALTYLLDTWDGNEDDKARVSIIEKIRTNPPSRDILFMILDAEVECGSISEMGALVELEDWDEEND